MPESSCLCGSVRIGFSAEPVGKFICHCLDDRKITGSLFSTNLMIPIDSLDLKKGLFKTYQNTAHSGNDMTTFFCGDCGSTLYRTSSGFPGIMMVKAGCIDDVDALDKLGMEGVANEFFVRSRVGWLPEFSATNKTETMK